MLTPIVQLLKENKADATMFSHTSIFNPASNLSFTQDKLEDFLHAYCEHHTADPIGINETFRHHYSPILVDVDLKVDMKNEHKHQLLYTREELETVISVYQTVIQQMVEDYSPEQVTCIVLEKEPYIDKTAKSSYFKNGFHLHFPYCFISKLDFDQCLVPAANKILKDKKLFPLATNPVEKIFDKIGLCWLMYGSVKDPEAKPYKATCSYNEKMERQSVYDGLAKYDIFQYGQNEKRIPITPDNVMYHLPRILSVMIYGRESYITDVKPEVRKSIISEIKIKPAYHAFDEFNPEKSKKEMEIAAKLLPLLNVRRAVNRSEWIDIGWILYNISHGSQEGFDLWNRFASRASNYDEMGCIATWSSMKYRPEKTIGSLKYYAKLDSPDEYQLLRNQDIENEVLHLTGTHTDIAAALKKLYDSDFICTSIKQNTWYGFEKHVWVKMDEATYLRSKLDDRSDKSSLANIIDKHKQSLINEMKGTEEKSSQRALLQDNIKRYQKIEKELQCTAFRNNVMREARDKFYNRDFAQKLNTNPSIIPFKNGVYDLKENIFRDGQPDDYYSRQLPIDYIEYEDDSEEFKTLDDFFKKVFVDQPLRDYFLDVYSNIFEGGNKDKCMFFWTGSGDNAKSVMQFLFEKMLGPFAIKLSTTLFSGHKLSAGAANAELARASDGVRWAFMDEPDESEELNLGYLKAITGGDSIFVRDLYEGGKNTLESILMFYLSMGTNVLPKLRGFDEAASNRLRVIQFSSCFNDKAPQDIKEQYEKRHFPVDRSLKEKLAKLCPAFAYYLLKRRMHRFSSIIEPVCVLEATNTYRLENDIYKQFVDDTYAFDDDPQHTLGVVEAYQDFKEWYISINTDSKPPNRNVFIKKIASVIKCAKRGVKWIGIKNKNSF